MKGLSWLEEGVCVCVCGILVIEGLSVFWVAGLSRVSSSAHGAHRV